MVQYGSWLRFTQESLGFPRAEGRNSAPHMNLELYPLPCRPRPYLRGQAVRSSIVSQRLVDDSVRPPQFFGDVVCALVFREFPASWISGSVLSRLCSALCKIVDGYTLLFLKNPPPIKNWNLSVGKSYNSMRFRRWLPDGVLISSRQARR